ncbi:MAG: ANTAR domain-containing protein [Planctomycetota bacterium]
MPDGKLRIMVADENEARGGLLAGVLAERGYDVVGLARGDSYLPSVVAEAKPDIILVNTESPSRDTLEQLTLIRRDQPRPVVMFASDEDGQTIRAAVKAGVSAYVTSGLNDARVQPVIELAIAHFREHQTVREELERTRTALQERQVIDKAKGILMRRRGCTEPEAFTMLRKSAMDRHKRIGQVAEEVVHMAELLEAKEDAPTHAQEAP